MNLINPRTAFQLLKNEIKKQLSKEPEYFEIVYDFIKDDSYFIIDEKEYDYNVSTVKTIIKSYATSYAIDQEMIAFIIEFDDRIPDVESSITFKSYFIKDNEKQFIEHKI